MTDEPRVPQTPNDVVLGLMKLSRRLDEVTNALNEKDEEATRKRAAHTLANSEAFIRAEGSVDLRKHKAVVETHDLRFAAELAEMEVRGLARAVKTLTTRIEVGRSTGAAVRSDISIAGSGVYGA
ncbi:hypothetical protein LTT66_18070 [Nocardia gipuzkoensis]|jgi:hypothetical protein|uniref:hypothetical protein n=1 Tax=Nocardia gipuzkoensis TaxID=2749991 RepID=UPI001E3C70BC|nr:hypothetical protein [Nocardia gipuzkoensis]UGT65277.1 hypothetical protein LTT66_18070 [Nocardia gipuzkoensis]